MPRSIGVPAPGSKPVQTAYLAAVGLPILAICLAAAQHQHRAASAPYAAAPPVPATVAGYVACDTYKANFARHLAAGRADLPQPVYTPQRFFPQSQEVLNYRLADYMLGCSSDAAITEISATLKDHTARGVEDWRRLLAAIIRSLRTELTHGDCDALLATLEDGALARARRSRAERGLDFGEDRLRLPDYILEYTVSTGRHHFHVYSDKPSASE
ncbi:hypothetical protein OPKNFCMD_2618 [Methylobacterium crusticola]|uniref:Uncharacterized protein n=1 Tax=Methylobacterium crusticola TaxID=1697972 RepID=A0ABQ4QZ89_9HYPH|nr:hypothetical protein [Methylobacterium crusticola]GJD49882.1 hypothetical protein OPKNFCMD_2618 [Methylobacterium crusticola]